MSEAVTDHRRVTARRTRRATLALGLTAVALLGACSSGSSSSSPTSTSAASGGGSSTTAAAGASTTASASASIDHLCTLFPKADAERLTGISLQAGADNADECTYDRADSTEHLAVVTVNLDRGADQPHQYDFNRSHPIGDEVLEDVTGVGDKAYYSAGQRSLVVLKGTALLHIFSADSHITDARGVDTRIAQLVLTNLG